MEIGGFNYKFTYQNPPEHMLLQECENDTRFNIRFALAAPKLVIDSLEAEQLKAGLYKVTAVVGNIGYLPTNVSEQANILKVSKPVEVTIEGGELLRIHKVEKENFMEELNKLVELGKSKDNTLNINEIRDFFKGETLSEEQTDFICSYLEGKDVDVLRVVTDELTPEESIILADDDDFYVELPIDLSRVLFIATANTTETIPRPTPNKKGQFCSKHNKEEYP